MIAVRDTYSLSAFVIFWLLEVSDANAPNHLCSFEVPTLLYAVRVVPVVIVKVVIASRAILFIHSLSPFADCPRIGAADMRLSSS